MIFFGKSQKKMIKNIYCYKMSFYEFVDSHLSDKDSASHYIIQQNKQIIFIKINLITELKYFYELFEKLEKKPFLVECLGSQNIEKNKLFFSIYFWFRYRF